MKRILLCYSLISLFFIAACKKDENNPSLPVSLPTVTTSSITKITSYSALGGGTVIYAGGKSVTARGICWSSDHEPTIANDKTIDGNGMGSFTSSITSLSANTTYYVRAYATNIAGTSYGSQVSFTTSTGIQLRTVIDIERNVYKTVVIGAQTWMAENLRTTKYNNGTDIPLVTDIYVWSNLTTPGYCWYNNDASAYKNTYGALYNWYTVNTGKLCPIGWHVPTDAEWITLATWVGGSDVAGGKLKEAGTTHWINPNTGATNEVGFTALPGGSRYSSGMFYSIECGGHWWTSSEYSPTNAWSRYMDNTFNYLYRGKDYKENGFSVRCVRDSVVP